MDYTRSVTHIWLFMSSVPGSRYLDWQIHTTICNFLLSVFHWRVIPDDNGRLNFDIGVWRVNDEIKGTSWLVKVYMMYHYDNGQRGWSYIGGTFVPTRQNKWQDKGPVSCPGLCVVREVFVNNFFPYVCLFMFMYIESGFTSVSPTLPGHSLTDTIKLTLYFPLFLSRKLLTNSLSFSIQTVKRSLSRTIQVPCPSPVGPTPRHFSVMAVGLHSHLPFFSVRWSEPSNTIGHSLSRDVTSTYCSKTSTLVAPKIFKFNQRI